MQHSFENGWKGERLADVNESLLASEPDSKKKRLGSYGIPSGDGRDKHVPSVSVERFTHHKISLPIPPLTNF